MSDTPADVIVPPRPGSLLREKRTENGWSVSDVAGVLRLSRAQVRAIEKDDYQHLPGRTYVLGYWKNYADLLEISIDESIAAHQHHLDEKVAGPLLGPKQTRLWHGAKPTLHHFGIAFALLSVFFLLGIWYWQHPPSASAPEWGNWDTGYDDWQDPGPELWDGEPDSPEATGDTEDETQSPTLPASLTARPEPNFSEENDPRRPVPVPTPPFQPIVAGQAGENATAATDASPPAEAPLEALVFVVERESWLEVQDGTGAQLIYRKVDGGQHLVLRGQSPFSVFIGNAEGVAVKYRGQPVSFAAEDGGVFARFTVGAP